MSELALKFQVPDDTVQSLQSELHRRGARLTRMLAHGYDTPDGLLARHGLSLCLPKQGRRWVQTLGSEAASAMDRFEHNVPLRILSGSQPVLDIDRHSGASTGTALRKLMANANALDLAELYTTDVSRHTCKLRPPGAVVEAALDMGTIKAGDRSASICELELELKSGDAQALFPLGKAWGSHGGLWLSTVSKSRRGALLASGQDHGPPVKARTPKLDEHMSGEQMLRAVILTANGGFGTRLPLPATSLRRSPGRRHARGRTEAIARYSPPIVTQTSRNVHARRLGCLIASSSARRLPMLRRWTLRLLDALTWIVVLWTALWFAVAGIVQAAPGVTE